MYELNRICLQAAADCTDWIERAATKLEIRAGVASSASKVCSAVQAVIVCWYSVRTAGRGSGGEDWEVGREHKSSLGLRSNGVLWGGGIKSEKWRPIHTGRCSKTWVYRGQL